MILKRPVTTSLLVLLFIGCNAHESDNTLKTKIVSDFRLSDKSKEHINGLYTVVMDNPSAQELAFANVKSPLGIVITDYNGEFVEKIGREGPGPNEIRDSRYFGFDNDHNIIILDKRTALFKQFDRTTSEVTSYKYPIDKGINVTSRNLQQCGNKWYLAIQLLGRPTSTAVPIVGVFNSEFKMIDSFGGYDPFFKGRKTLMQEPVIDVDCEAGLIYTTHAKIPFIQVYSLEQGKRVGRTKRIPSSFRISDKFIPIVKNPRAFTKYLAEEQSVSLHIVHSSSYIFLIVRNNGNADYRNPNLNDREHFVAAYDKENLQYIGEAKIDGAVLGSTKEGDLIVLADELKYRINYVRVYK